MRATRYCTRTNKNDEGVIEDIGFQGEGCAISKASASLMTSNIKGKTQSDVLQLKDEFHKMVTGELDPVTQAHHLAKNLTILQGVKEYPFGPAILVARVRSTFGMELILVPAGA